MIKAGNEARPFISSWLHTFLCIVNIYAQSNIKSVLGILPFIGKRRPAEEWSRRHHVPLRFSPLILDITQMAAASVGTVCTPPPPNQTIATDLTNFFSPEIGGTLPLCDIFR